MHNKEDQFKEILAGMRAPEGLSNEDAWNKLQARIQAEQTPVRSIQRSAPRWWAAAAAVVVLAVGAFMFWPSADGVTVVAEQPQEVTLPDGSTVFLNDGAQASWNAETWEEERVVSLKGEGFFQVKKGESFEVRTAEGSVFVLGTSFNVNTDGSFQVDCFTGKVGVETAVGEVELTPGECAMIREQQLVEVTFDQAAHDWKAGKQSFDQAPIPQIAAAISKAYDVELSATGLENEYLTMPIDTHAQSLNDVLRVLELYGYLTVESGGTLTLKKSK